MSRVAVLLSLLLSLLGSLTASGAEPRARDLGVPFDGVPGPLNAITDVRGVTVGQVTLIEDLADQRKVRTGVTAILPRGHDTLDRPGVRGLVRAQRQRRDDRHGVDRRIRSARGTGAAHEHAQRRCRT